MLEAHGKTVDEALSNGLRDMDLTKDLVDITVLDEGSKGFLGIGARPARLLLTEKLKSQIEAQRRQESAAKAEAAMAAQAVPEPRRAQPPSREPETAPVTKQERKQEPKQDAAREAKPETRPKPGQAANQQATQQGGPADDARREQQPRQREQAKAPMSVQTADERPQRQEKDRRQPPGRTPQRADRPERRQPERSNDHRPQRPGQPRQRPPRMTDERTLSPQESAAMLGEAKRYFTDITEKMGVSVGIAGEVTENGLHINASGPDAGTLIGYRGETLDALQYLVSLQVNKGEEGYLRVTLDAENYRLKREETLVKLAHRLAHKAVKTGKKVTLEPMNPYERRILHSALQGNGNVRTHSEGEEPYRRVVISPKREQGRNSAAE